MRRPKTTSLYVYYRVAADSTGARKRIRALLADIETRTGIRGALLARSDDPTTWMETYAPVTRATAFRRLLDQLAEEHEAAALTTDGQRHVEAFGALPPLPMRRVLRKA